MCWLLGRVLRDVCPQPEQSVVRNINAIKRIGKRGRALSFWPRPGPRVSALRKFGVQRSDQSYVSVVQRDLLVATEDRYNWAHACISRFERASLAHVAGLATTK